MNPLLLLALSLSICACERAASVTPAPAAEGASEKPPLSVVSDTCVPASDLLAENVIVAEYIGTEEIPCRFMTADCPDKCDHGTKVALFRILSNESYTTHSEYGDPMMEAGETVFVDIRRPAPGQVALPTLNKGDKLRLTIQHRYTKGNVREPIRPVTAVEKL